MNTVPLIPLEAAMEQLKIAEESRPLVRQIALRAGVIGCEVKSSYIKAMREDGLHPLHIGKRSTEWFGSRREAIAASDLPDRVRDKTHGNGMVNWAVDFPVTKRSMSPGVQKKITPATGAEEKSYGVCEVCWQARTPSGSCGCD
ncbi:hypothetical protein QQX09_08090 [Demequina sp. SYSU T00192]|uniref:Uncharacterized protein n=1 Tax=Demequina litoralis TaxID=3051660 RepID=A0ABT8G9J4_9MICO|nr:hypothetical protein [Demequina sp. SYSU T00192]MDN4475815.1 hypothetical protein [Demequina sp. SYSU T00192]